MSTPPKFTTPPVPPSAVTKGATASLHTIWLDKPILFLTSQRDRFTVDKGSPTETVRLAHYVDRLTLIGALGAVLIEKEGKEYLIPASNITHMTVLP